MRDPVMCTDGHSYEREAIERWINENTENNQVRSPMVGGYMSTTLFPNFALKNAIEEYNERHTSDEETNQNTGVTRNTQEEYNSERNARRRNSNPINTNDTRNIYLLLNRCNEIHNITNDINTDNNNTNYNNNTNNNNYNPTRQYGAYH